MKSNYFTIHKNKKPKKAKYSKWYTKKEFKKMEECRLFFIQKIELLKSKNK